VERDKFTPCSLVEDYRPSRAFQRDLPPTVDSTPETDTDRFFPATTLLKYTAPHPGSQRVSSIPRLRTAYFTNTAVVKPLNNTVISHDYFLSNAHSLALTCHSQFKSISLRVMLLINITICCDVTPWELAA